MHYCIELLQILDDMSYKELATMRCVRKAMTKAKTLTLEVASERATSCTVQYSVNVSTVVDHHRESTPLHITGQARRLKSNENERSCKRSEERCVASHCVHFTVHTHT